MASANTTTGAHLSGGCNSRTAQYRAWVLGALRRTNSALVRTLGQGSLNVAVSNVLSTLFAEAEADAKRHSAARAKGAPLFGDDDVSIDSPPHTAATVDGTAALPILGATYASAMQPHSVIQHFGIRLQAGAAFATPQGPVPVPGAQDSAFLGADDSELQTAYKMVMAAVTSGRLAPNRVLELRRACASSHQSPTQSTATSARGKRTRQGQRRDSVLESPATPPPVQLSIVSWVDGRKRKLSPGTVLPAVGSPPPKMQRKTVRQSRIDQATSRAAKEGFPFEQWPVDGV